MEDILIESDVFLLKKETKAVDLLSLRKELKSITPILAKLGNDGDSQKTKIILAARLFAANAVEEGMCVLSSIPLSYFEQEFEEHLEKDSSFTETARGIADKLVSFGAVTVGITLENKGFPYTIGVG